MLAAWQAAKYVEASLYGVTPADPVTIAAAAAICAIVALFAGLIPARRAMRVDPVRTLRWE